MTITLPSSYQPLTIASGVHAAAGATPGKTAIREGDRTLSYVALSQRIRQVTGGVIDGLGLQRGDHVAILSPNCLSYVEIVCGAAAAGHMVVLICRITLEEITQ